MEIFRMSIQKIKEKHMYTQIWQRKRNDEGKWCEQWQKRKINENENENEFPNNRNSFLLQKFLIVDAHSTTDKTTTTSDRWEHTEKQRYCKTTEKFFDYKTHATIGKSGKCSILLWLNVSTLPWELLKKKKNNEMTEDEKRLATQDANSLHLTQTHSFSNGFSPVN